MKFDVQSIKTVSRSVEHHDEQLTHSMEPKSVKRFLNKIGEENLRQLILVQRSDKQAQRGTRDELEAMDRALMTYEDAASLGQLRALDKYDDLITEVVQSAEAFQIKDLAVNGHDMMSLDLQGKDIGNTLKHLLEGVIEHPELNNRETLMEAATRYRDTVILGPEPLDLDDQEQTGREP
jgi:tRNA nucleotidyltransferase (CCA-adding enzyme)